MKPDTPAEPEYAFARRHRLTKTDEFSSVFGFRRAIRGQLLIVHYRPRESGSEARLGLVVGKKLLKAAVRRNLLKRLVREQFRRMKSNLPACDIVVRLAAKPDRMDRKAIAAEVATLLGKLAHRVPRNVVVDER